MKVKHIIELLEELSPLSYSEGFDNTGLLVGNQETDITGILVTLDTLEGVVDEAIAKDCNLIVSFHPIIFSGLKKLTGETYVERVVQKAIGHNIAIFSNHTALDNSWNGVNAAICDRLNLQNRKILLPKKGTIKKLLTYVPTNAAESVRKALWEAGAGNIGNYENCSFNVNGHGSFKGNDDSDPTVGSRGKLHFGEEVEVGMTFAKHLEKKILTALFSAHPYEEVAYEITTLDNLNQGIGMGMVGELPIPISETDFLESLKKTMNTDCVRYSTLRGGDVKKVAVLGGSGSFAIEAAIAAKADVFVSADFKYHDFFRAEGKIVLADIGHYESEQFTKELLYSFLKKKLINFAPSLPKGKVMISETNTNPISYL